MLRQFRAYIALTHPWAVLIVMIATAFFGLLAGEWSPPLGRYLLMLAGMLGGQIAIGATNEWFDRLADARDKPQRPIPSGRVTAAGALRFAWFGLLLMTTAGAMLGVLELVLLAVGTGAGLLYNAGLKRTPLSWLPYLVALPLLPVWVWLVIDGFLPELLWLYPLGAAFVLAIHLSQTLPDIAGDTHRGEHGIAVVLGRRWAILLIWLAAIASTLAVIAGSWLSGGEILPALVTGGMVMVILVTAMAAMHVEPDRVQPHLFKVLTTSAIILAAGWIMSVTG